MVQVHWATCSRRTAFLAPGGGPVAVSMAPLAAANYPGSLMTDPIVGTGAESSWTRITNAYPGCSCPRWRYHPVYPKPTDPHCPQHGENA